MKFGKVINLVLLCASHLQAASFYVAPGATASGDGSFAKPWALQQALLHPPALKPGDTVWLRAGIYENAFDTQTSFSCYTKGKPNAPILFRNFMNERAIIDGDLFYSLYVGLGNCSDTWFWGIEVTNSHSTTRNQNIAGGVTCTAENIKFINMIIYDTGHGLDVWKSAKNTEVYGCMIYHIGNNLANNGNLEGHGHGMYLQNDTFEFKKIHNNIIFSTYGNGINIWQTTTSAAIGNFDIQRNIVFNGGAASENLGGFGNNARTHNFFILSNGVNNPLVNTAIKHNYTYSGTNIPRPPVNAFGLNFGVRNFVLDSNYLSCQTRLGFNNTPIFDASVKGNKIIAGIPAIYGNYLWGFSQSDFPMNDYIPQLPQQGLEYFVLPNKYDTDRSHLVIYNWDSASSVSLDLSNADMTSGDTYEMINVMDPFHDTFRVVYPENGIVQLPMTGHTFVKPIASNQMPASPFPKFGVFILRRHKNLMVNIDDKSLSLEDLMIKPNPSSGVFELSNIGTELSIDVIHISGKVIRTVRYIKEKETFELNLKPYPKGLYYLKIYNQQQSVIKIVVVK